MNHYAYDLRMFYASGAGRLVRRLVSDHLSELWTDTKGFRVAGYGYAVPYLRPFAVESERCFALMPAGQGAHTWAAEGNLNQVCLTTEHDFPLETESVDRLLIVHGLEHAESAEGLLQEAWRVLRSNGRMILVVPNRLGLWARADWMPFGQGHPYSSVQITNLLQQNLFVREREDKALFMPPFRSLLVLRSAYLVEDIGRIVFPGLAGLHIVEASKQIYAGIHRGHPARVRVPARVAAVSAPVKNGRNTP